MRSSTEGYRPAKAEHIRESDLCGTCRTLITTARGSGGKAIGALPEQMPYPEWLHSDYRDKQSCQSCHMPAIKGPVQISRVLGEEREGARLHSFLGGNLFMLQLLEHYLDVLYRKPGALAGSKPLEQKRRAGLWPPSFDRIWEALMERHGKQGGTKQMIDLLKL